MNAFDLANKLCLGTAQFGSAYGISNETGVVSDKTIHAILDRCRVKYYDLRYCTGLRGCTAENWIN